MCKKVLCLFFLFSQCYADLSTGIVDEVGISYARDYNVNVNSYAVNFAYDLPIYLQKNTAVQLAFSIGNWQDGDEHSFLQFEVLPSVRYYVPVDNDFLQPYLELGVGAAYFGRKDFATFHLNHDFLAVTRAMLGMTFGEQYEFDAALGYSYYGLGSSDEIQMATLLSLSYHF